MARPGPRSAPVRYDQKAFCWGWGIPFLFIFEEIFGNDTLEQLGGGQDHHLLRPAGTLSLAIGSATLQSVAIRLQGPRKRDPEARPRRPLPPWGYSTGRVGNALTISLLMLVIVAGMGHLLYGVSIPWEHLPASLAGHGFGRRRQLLLPRDRARRGGGERGRGPTGTNFRRAAAVLPVQRARAGDRGPNSIWHTAGCTRSGRSSRRSSRPRTRPRAALGRVEDLAVGRGLGGCGPGGTVRISSAEHPAAREVNRANAERLRR